MNSKRTRFTEEEVFMYTLDLTGTLVCQFQSNLNVATLAEMLPIQEYIDPFIQMNLEKIDQNMVEVEVFI